MYGVKQNGTERISYAYDKLARLYKRTLNTTTPFVTQYSYHQGATSGTTTTLVKTVQNGSDSFEYAYDAVGNITQIKKNNAVYETYTYDNLNQLKTVTRGSDTYTYNYDSGGNIQSVTLNGSTIKNYTYGDIQWFDLLTAYNGQTITYDQIGNPLQYRDGFNFTWSNGRQLTGITKGTDNISYLYNADGLRASKNVNGITTDYYWLDGVLLGEKTGNDYITYLYDENGVAYGIICNNTYYYYVFNAQGDVVGIIDSTGTQVVSYDYSAWGEVLSITGTMADTLGQQNPIRYRGYHYDNETGFYYLQSRYYDPITQRFLNADGLVSTGQGILGNNMFIYCGNNPVNRKDATGQFWLAAIITTVVVAVTAGIVHTVAKSEPSKKKKYSSIDDATKDWTETNKPKSQYNERGAFIYKETDPETKETLYSIGRTYEGTDSNVISGFVTGYLGGQTQSLFSDKEMVAFIHTHPQSEPTGSNDSPSAADLWLLNLPGISEVYIVPWDVCEDVPEIIKGSNKAYWDHVCYDIVEVTEYVY